MAQLITTPVNLACRRYNTFAAALTALDANGYAVPLYGCAARLQARTAAGAADPPLLDLSTDGPTGNGSILSIDANGNIALLVQASDIDAMAPAAAPVVLAWDVLVTLPYEPTPVTTHAGAWTINPNVTTAPAAATPPGALDLSNPWGGVETALVFGVI